MDGIERSKGEERSEGQITSEAIAQNAANWTKDITPADRAAMRDAETAQQQAAAEAARVAAEIEEQKRVAATPELMAAAPRTDAPGVDQLDRTPSTPATENQSPTSPTESDVNQPVAPVEAAPSSGPKPSETPTTPSTQEHVSLTNRILKLVGLKQ